MELRVHLVNVNHFQERHVSMKRSYSMVPRPQIQPSFGKVKMASICAILPMECGVVAHISPQKPPTATMDLLIITQKGECLSSF